MASDGVKDQLWLQRWDITRCVQYYARQGRWRSLVQTFTQAFLLGSSMLALSAAFGLIPPEIGIPTSAVTALLIVLSYTFNHPHRLAAILSASEKCRAVDKESKVVWHTLEFLSDEEAMKKWARLQEELDAATTPVERDGVGYNKRLNEQSAEVASEILKHEPAPASHQLT
jgi:hypothetical protein